MEAWFEPLSGLMRVGVVPKHGEPYKWTCSVRFIRRDHIELCGYTEEQHGKLTKTIYKAIYRHCQRTGIKKVRVTTYTNGEERERDIPIRCIGSGKP